MEDTLRDKNKTYGNIDTCLNPCFNGRYSQRIKKSSGRRDRNLVLILVLMEDTLRGIKKNSGRRDRSRLNPCFNGRYSQRSLETWVKKEDTASLNPCFNGRYSQRPEALSDFNELS